MQGLKYITDDGLKNIQASPEQAYLLSEFTLTSGKKLSEQEKEQAEEVYKVSKQFLPVDFDERVKNNIIQPEGESKIVEDPQTAFKESWNVYANATDPETMLKAKAVNQRAKLELLKKNIDPSELLETPGPGKKLWNVVSKALDTTSNLTANLYTIPKGLGKVDIWGGKGWNDAIHRNQLAENPELNDILRKITYNQELTAGEIKTYQDFQKRKLWGGLAGNVLLDVGNLASFGLGKIGKAKGLAKLDKVDEITKVGKSIAGYSDELLKGTDKLGDYKKAMEITQNILAKPVLNIDDINELKKVGSLVKGTGGKQITKSITNFEKHLNKIDKFQQSKFITGLLKKDEVIGKAIDKVIEAPFIRTVIRKAFLSDLPMAFKGSKDIARIAKHTLQAKGDEIHRVITANIKQIAKQTGKKYDDIARQVTHFVERGGDASPEIKNLAKLIKSERDAAFLKEIRSGIKIKPNQLNKDDAKAWDELSQQYRTLHAVNPTDPAIKKVENDLTKLMYGINDKGGNIATAEGLLGYDLFTTSLENGVPEYMLRALTPEAREFLNGNRANTILDLMDDDALNLVKKAASPVGEHSSQIERNFQKMSIGQINHIAEQGKFLKGFTGKMFVTDPAELMKLRFNKAAKAMEQTVFNDELLKLKQVSDAQNLGLFSDKWSKGLEKIKLNLLDGSVVDTFVAKDVATAIKKMGKFEKLPAIIKFYDNAMSFLRRFTILPFPSSRIRDELGNLYVMAQAGWNPFKGGGRRFQEAISLMTNPAYADKFTLVTESGRLFTGKKLLQLAQETGALEPGVIREFGKISDKIGFAKGQVAQALENHAKMTLFMDLVQKGADPLTAAKEVRKMLFDYGDLTTFESQVMRRTTFFYTWFRKILGVQIEKLLTLDPVLRSTLKIAESLNRRNPDDFVDRRYQAQYLADTPTVSIKKTPQKETLLSLEGVIPSFELSKLARAASGDVTDFTSMISPILSTPVELGLNKNFFNQKPIEAYPGQKINFLGFNVPAKVAHILNKLRVLSFANRLNPGGIGGTDEKLSLGGSARMTPDTSIESKIIQNIVGKPIEYDTGFAKIMTEKDFRNEMYTQLAGVKSDIKRLQENYKGDVAPVKDFRDLSLRYQKLAGIMEDGYKTGKFNPGSPEGKRLLSTLRKTGEAIEQYILSYGEQ